MAQQMLVKLHTIKSLWRVSNFMFTGQQADR